MDEKPLRRVKSGLWSRGMAMARMTAKLAAHKVAHDMAHATKNVMFGGEARRQGRIGFLRVQAQTVFRELGQLKGGAMKAGQMLSMFGEHFLPPEANAFLRLLHDKTPPLAWSAIEAALLAELGAERLAELDVSTTPLGTASIGQVHRATVRQTGEQIVLKVQYPGVAAAIEADLRAVRRLLTLARLIPQGARLDPLFDEVRDMLVQEVDYEQERRQTEVFHALLQGDSRYIVPQTLPRYCSGKILATTYEPGVAVDGPEVHALPLARRNALAKAGFELYLRELLVWRRVQTDPHFGNYRVRLAGVPTPELGNAWGSPPPTELASDPQQGAESDPDRLVLLDFGAVREVPRASVAGYRDLIAGSCAPRTAQLLRGADALGLIEHSDTQARRDAFVRLCTLCVEPFASPHALEVRQDLFDVAGAYDFGRSDLPQRLARLGAQSVGVMGLRAPPRESIFLDRKLAGVFIFMATLRAQFSGRAMLADAVASPDASALSASHGNWAPPQARMHASDDMPSHHGPHDLVEAPAPKGERLPTAAQPA